MARPCLRCVFVIIAPLLLLTPAPAVAADVDVMCDPSFQNCRATAGPIYVCTTAGTTEPPSGTPLDIVLYAAEATATAGAWAVAADATAAGGKRIRHPNAAAAKVATPLATPASFFELTFNAESGRPYRLWIRGKADVNSYANDSVFVQFSGSTNSSGAPVFRIGGTTATEFNLESCSGCGLANGGWEDNGWGAGVMGPQIYSARSGAQTIRVQPREDGWSIDQIVLAPAAYLTSPPGAAKNDATIMRT